MAKKKKTAAKVAMRTTSKKAGNGAPKSLTKKKAQGSKTPTKKASSAKKSGATTAMAMPVFAWHELNTSDPAICGPFYASLFGWTTSSMDMGGGRLYTLFNKGSESIAGMDAVGPGTPSHWMMYVGVDDVDATAAKCRALGGDVLMPPMDIPPGRMAMLRDPSGAVFSVYKPQMW